MQRYFFAVIILLCACAKPSVREKQPEIIIKQKELSKPQYESGIGRVFQTYRIVLKNTSPRTITTFYEIRLHLEGKTTPVIKFGRCKIKPNRFYTIHGEYSNTVPIVNLDIKIKEGG
jgi:hypothetical protein